MIRIAILYALGFAALIAVTDAGWLPNFAEHIHHLPYCDKAIHFTLYGLLALVANLAILNSGRWSAIRAIVLGSAIVLIVATAEEYSNRFVAVRDWSLGDLAANYLGVLIIGTLPLLPRALAASREITGPESAFPPTV